VVLARLLLRRSVGGGGGGGESRAVADVLTIVVLGASGDLAKKKTYPALFSLFCEGYLPARVQIIGYARSSMSSADLREKLHSSLTGDSTLKTLFLDKCTYVQGAYDTPEGYRKLSSIVWDWEQASGFGSKDETHFLPSSSSSSTIFGRLFYLALPPSVYPEVMRNLRYECAAGPSRGTTPRVGCSFTESSAASPTVPSSSPMNPPPPPPPFPPFPSSSSSTSTSARTPHHARSYSGLVSDARLSPHVTSWCRIIIEKPFGRDLASSEALSEQIGSMFSENHLYRIDHYLGKELAQNMLILRFANVFLEPIWNRHYVSNVSITFKEPFGTQGRGGYFDHYGIIRDVMQNHLLQVLSLVAMEKPVSLSPEDIRDEKVKVLRCMEGARPEDTVIGQYVSDGANKGYLEDPGVPHDSITPTYAATVLKINNERWYGVPFFMKAGKALNERKAEVRIQFKPIATNIFNEAPTQLSPDTARNELVIRFQPDEAIYMKMCTKTPGLGMNTTIGELDLTYKERFDSHRIPEAYERLILDALRGDQQHFVRRDELRASWKVFDRLLAAVDGGDLNTVFYRYGSTGPKEAYALQERFGYVRTANYQWDPKPLTSSSLGGGSLSLSHSLRESLDDPVVCRKGTPELEHIQRNLLASEGAGRGGGGREGGSKVVALETLRQELDKIPPQGEGTPTQEHNSRPPAHSLEGLPLPSFYHAPHEGR